MIDQLARVTGVFRDSLKKVALGHPVGYIVAYGFGPVKLETGETKLLPAFIITVTLPNPLIGQPDFSLPAIIPAYAGMPNDKSIKETAEAALEMIRQMADEALRITQ